MNSADSGREQANLSSWNVSRRTVIRGAGGGSVVPAVSAAAVLPVRPPHIGQRRSDQNEFVLQH